MAAAAALHGAGAAVTLLEARRELGGRAGSFEDAATGQLLDNCQHVLLGCCTNLLDLYRRLGVAEKVHFHRRIHFLDEGGHHYALFRVPGLPAPLHLAPALASFGVLSVAERWAISRAMGAMLRLGRAGRAALDDVPFGRWLRDHGQTERIIRRFYDPILVGALNEQTSRASAKYALQVFQDGLLSHRGGYALGLPACPLEELYANRPCPTVRLNTRVTSLCFQSRRIVGVALRDGEILPANAVILAVNHPTVLKWIPEELRQADFRFHRLLELRGSPIVGAHLWFDRPVLPYSHAALLAGPLQWLFRKDRRGAAVHGVISAARDWLEVPEDVLIGQIKTQLAQLFPKVSATLLRHRIIIEKRATFSPLPGVEAFRPLQTPPPGGLENLFLAGDYTKTDWPATMEGAVRSGYLAAEGLWCSLAGAAPVPRFLAPDLPLEFPARLLARGRSCVTFTAQRH